MLPDLLALQKQIASGDQRAFRDFYIFFRQRLLTFASTMSRSKELAATAVEDVFVRLWVNRSEIERIENISVYLYVAVRNQCTTYLSPGPRNLFQATADAPDLFLHQLNSDPHSILVTSEMLSRMHDAIENLPPRCKMIFKLIREDGLKYKEVAEIMKISTNTIDVQMAIAIKRICEAVGLSRNRAAKR